ncbi:MAG: DNA polymerase III subunit alpha, partial [Proteobacteria bacterium]|nr:DNA polymerase III subunit alpha [Pseudomonadota bacterium]
GYFLPKYPVPESYNFDTFLEELSNKNLKEIIKNFNQADKDLYQQRLDYELTQINEMGFSSYFLIVYDFIKWSKNNNVPVGPGRGSGAGSLVAFCLGITSLDPIEHGLLFERFLNPERLSMPDFDIDFCMEKRDKVIEYVSNKYGSDAVSQIATFGTMAARAVVRDVCRAMGKPYALGDRIAKMIPFAPGMTLDRARQEQPIFDQSIKNDDEVREIVNMSYKLEGIARNVGKHAGGVVIAPGSISEFCPIYVERQSSSVMTQYDKDDVEKIGLVKFDFLGLRTLTVIDKAIQSINSQKNNGKAFDIENIPLDDQHVFNMLSSGKTMAVFQLESAGMRDLIKRLKPTKFEEITALLALYRPGPLDSGMHDEFVNRKHGKTSVTYPHELLEEVLKETYGVILYQEQVMEAARVLAGFSLGEADILRRAMGKKKVKEMEEQRAFFRDGCEKNNINKSLADKIFDLIEKFAGYGFNKSHSAAYALISYQTAYLKHYYPEHYMAAVLSTELGNTDKIFSLLKECERMGINVLSPNILTSFKEFIVNKDKHIEFGLGAIKGASSSFIDHIINIRKNNSFEDLWDFSRKIDIKMGGK